MVFYQPYRSPGADADADAREGIVTGIQYNDDVEDPITLLNGQVVETVPPIHYVSVRDSVTGRGYYVYPDELIPVKDVTSWLNG